MAYVTPPTFVASDPLAAADLNILGDDIAHLKAIVDGVSFSSVTVTRTANTSIADSTWTPVTWSAEVLDVGGWYSSGTDIVVPSGAIPAGFTTIAVDVIPYIAQFDNNTVGIRGARIVVNGTPSVLNSTQAGMASDDTVVNSTGQLIVAAADVITMEVYQSSGSALNAYGMRLTISRRAPVA